MSITIHSYFLQTQDNCLVTEKHYLVETTMNIITTIKSKLSDPIVSDLQLIKFV